MSLPPARVSSAEAPIVSQILPTGISLVTLVNETLRISFRYDQTPTVDLPSLWRLAKHVVYERGPLLVSRYKEQP
jgi:hypothetical protein